jgi:integrase/recombinase XerD
VSRLSKAAEDYLQLRRRLGHKLDEAGRLLPRFIAYLDANGIDTVTVEAALAWAGQAGAPAGSTVAARRLTVARGFARHLAGIDGRAEVPAVALLPRPSRRRVPYIYSDTDIAALMAQAHRSIRHPLRAATFETLIGLLAVTGMRVGEAIRMDRSDIDWTNAVITITATKFNKSRQIPLQPSALDALARYARRRDELQPTTSAASFFVSIVGARLWYANVRPTFATLLRETGVGATAPQRPRIHDLRHSFAVRTLIGWYRDGEDVQARLPWLSTYLGHREPVSTYWYLSAVPELLALAAARLPDRQAP